MKELLISIQNKKLNKDFYLNIYMSIFIIYIFISLNNENIYLSNLV